MIIVFVWEYQTLPLLTKLEFGERLRFLPSPFLTREYFRCFGSTSSVSVSGGQPVGHPGALLRLFVVVDAAFVVTDGERVCSPNLS